MKRRITLAVVLTITLCLVAAFAGGTTAGGTGQAGSPILSAFSASANSCHAEVEDRGQFPAPREYRVIAWCDSLDPSTSVRGVLDTAWSPDAHTDWFTSTGVEHYSGWRADSWAIAPSARVEYATR